MSQAAGTTKGRIRGDTRPYAPRKIQPVRFGLAAGRGSGGNPERFLRSASICSPERAAGAPHAGQVPAPAGTPPPQTWHDQAYAGITPPAVFCPRSAATIPRLFCTPDATPPMVLG